jgi:hypothetical protein
MSNSPFVFVRVLILLGLSVTTLRAQVDSKIVWRDFREAYPYHIQTLALTDVDSEGRRILIISEPPPGITIARLKNVSPAALQDMAVLKHGIGYDGWVEDIVVSLPATSRAELASLIDSLHRELFGTTYKATVVPLPTRPPEVSKASLDLRVPTRELGYWILGSDSRSSSGAGVWTILVVVLLWFLFLWSVWTLLRRDRKWWTWAITGVSLGVIYLLISGWIGSPSRSELMLSFSPVLGGQSATGREILDRKISGVFFSDKPGVVLWAIPRAAPLNTYPLEARQFALDSDMVIGAIASDDHLVVVGRERSFPVASLPPLRNETIFQLAAADTDELAQSYERKDIFAGKFDGAHDWAPIYLSQALVDTEYGSLLNITDQLLKSWSMHGLVRYINFKYPNPTSFPFPSPLSEYAHTSQVTFNWNTKGAGYTAKNGTYEIFALNRTGALPVDYLSSDNSELQQAEEKAYGYFAGLSDPNLVRVVQYAALYQIFRRFGIKAQANPIGEPLHPPESYRAPLGQIIEKVASLSDEKIDQVARELEARSAPRSQVAQIRNLASMRDEINQVKEEGPGAELELVDAIAAPRLTAADLRGRTDSQLTTLDKEIQDLVGQFGQNKGLLQELGDVDLDSIRQAYVAESRRAQRNWIRTPSIVLSWIEGEMGQSATGGHNLDSRITMFRTDGKLSAGEIKVSQENGNNVILHSAEDADKVTELVRLAGRNEDKSPSEIETLLKQKLPEIQVAERTLPQALGFTADVHPPSTRGYQELREVPGLGNTGWKVTQEEVGGRQSEILYALTDPNAHAIVVSRQANGNYLVAHSASKLLVDSSDLPSAVDAVTSCINAEAQADSKVTVYLAGFETRQGRGFAHSLEMNVPEEQRIKITAAIEGDPIPPEDLSRILKEDYDLAKAKVTVRESAEQNAIDVSLDVPAKSAAKPTLLVRLRIWLNDGVMATTELLQSVQSVIARWQLTLTNASEKINLLFAHKALLHDLQTVHPGIKSIDVNFSREGRDILHADNLDPRQLSDSSRQAG